MRTRTLTFLLGGSLMIVAAPAEAHFSLMAPPNSSTEADGKGPPPCGGPENTVITPAQGGHPLHLKVTETVYHRGHYRVALSINARSELPADPTVYDKNKNVLDPAKLPAASSDSCDVQATPVFPVLVDNLWDHAKAPSAAMEADVMLPNVSCDKCTLQIIEFMADHGSNYPNGGYFYHHCANLKITADPALPPFTGGGNGADAGVDAGGAKDGGVDAGNGGGGRSGGNAGNGGGGSKGTGGVPATGGTTATGGSTSSTGGASTGGAATGGAATGGASTGGNGTGTATGGARTGGAGPSTGGSVGGGSDGGGCATAGDVRGGAAGLFLGLVALVVGWRRSRRRPSA